MIFQIAFILVAIGTFSLLWAILEVVASELYAKRYKKSIRSKTVRNGFDK